MKVVIIDDSVSSLAAMSEYVRGLADAECVSFTRAMHALNWLEGNPVDLVVVDYLMPGIDGLDFIGKFRQLPNQDGVPIVMVTASNLRHVRYMALQMGATDFLTKPVDPVEFTVRITNLLSAYATHKALECHLAELSAKVARATADLAEREREALFFIGRTAEHRDVETGKHLLRMSTYSWLIAQAIGLPEDEAHRLRLASPLHDVGKVAIPDDILLKPGKLTDAEYAVMKRHAQLGADILSGSRSPLLQLACEIAFTHHEKFDGSGYPRRLAGCDIPLSGRIVAVADVFDALSNARPYKRPWSFDDSHRYLQAQAGSHFDPDCVDAFTRMIDRVREVHELNRE